jgi:hypothetical protein
MAAAAAHDLYPSPRLRFPEVSTQLRLHRIPMMIIVAVTEIPLRLFLLHCSSDQVGILEVGDVVTVLETRSVGGALYDALMMRRARQ